MKGTVKHKGILLRLYIFFNVAFRPDAGHGLLILDVSRSHSTMYNSRQDSSGRVISPKQISLRDNIQHAEQKNTNAPGGIRTRSPRRKSDADLGLRPRGHWDQCLQLYKQHNPYVYY